MNAMKVSTPRTPRRLVAAVGGAVEESAWWAARTAVRHPVASPAALALSVAVTPVTTVEAALATGMALTCGGLGVAVGGSARRRRALSLAAEARARLRVKRVRRRWKRATTDAGLVKPALEKGRAPRRPRIIRATPNRYGVTVHVDLSPIGANPEQLREKHRVLLSTFGAKLAKVREIMPGKAELMLMWTDPLDRIIRTNQLPKTKLPLHVVVGIDEDGDAVAQSVRLPRLTVGAQGAGKSCEVWTILYQLQRQGIPHRVRVMDPKQGMEFGQLEGAAHDYESDPDQWGYFIHRAARAMEQRQKQLRAEGVREHVPTEEHPLEVIIIDELLAILDAQKAKFRVGKGAALDPAALFRRILSQGRAAGFVVIGLCQDGTKEVVGPVRSLFPYRTCLRVPEDHMADVVLGSSKSYPAHLIPATQPGVGFCVTPAGTVRYRAALLGRREINSVVAGLRRRRGKEDAA